MADGIEETEDEGLSEEDREAEYAKLIETGHRQEALQYALALSHGLTTSGAQLVKDAKTIQKFLWEE